jgi:hypothetical protein
LTLLLLSLNLLLLPFLHRCCCCCCCCCCCRRQYQEVPLATRSGNALASLLGFGYMVLYTWQARSEPASGLIKRHVDAFAGTGHARNRLSV